MGEIYKITNKINGKVYFGQTAYTTETRWETHLQGLYKLKDSVLYRAMRKHGVENFEIECLEECEDDKLDEREIHYIQHYSSYKDGYNATLGGGGSRHVPFDKDIVMRLWDEGCDLTDISYRTENNIQTIRDFLSSSGVADYDLFYRGKRRGARQVCRIDFLTRDGLEVYSSIVDAANSLCKSSAKIVLTCSGKANSAHGYFWRYWEDISQDDKDWMYYSGDMPTPPKERADNEIVCRLYLEGVCTNSIAERLNISRGHVYLILREANIRLEGAS